MSELSRAQDDILLQKKCEKILAEWWGMTGGDPNVYLYRAAYADGAEESKNIIAQQAQELERVKREIAGQDIQMDAVRYRAAQAEQQLAASQARCSDLEVRLNGEEMENDKAGELIAQLQATLAAREASYDRMRDNWSAAMQDAARLREALEAALPIAVEWCSPEEAKEVAAIEQAQRALKGA